MRMKSVAFLAAGAVVLLASCTSAPRAQTLTVELFDSKAVHEQWVPVTLPVPFLPIVPDSRSSLAVSSPLSATGSLPVASSPAQAPEPSSILSYDAGLTSPNRPRAKAAFALVAPPLPVLSTAAAPRSAQSRQPKVAVVPAAPVVSGPPQAPASTPAPAPPASSLARSTANSASSPAAGSSAGPNGSYGRLREIYAREGDVLQVGLDGVGFLFLGLPDRQADGVSFKTKENRNNKTWFTFQALKIGTYDLDFLQQDNMAGKTTRETVRVHVVSDKDFNAAVAPQQGQESAEPGSVDEGDPAFAQKLTNLGSYQAAVVELLKGYRDGNPALNDQIARLYMRMGSYDAAGKYYGKNLTPQNALTPGAIIGLVRIAALQNDQQGLVASLRRFLELKDPSMEEPLIQAVRMEKGRSEIGMALDLAGEYVKRFPDGTWRDEADYLSAQLLEADSQFRDIARARGLYNGIVTSRPESVFADAARQRLQYIDRHFIQVR